MYMARAEEAGNHGLAPSITTNTSMFQDGIFQFVSSAQRPWAFPALRPTLAFREKSMVAIVTSVGVDARDRGQMFGGGLADEIDVSFHSRTWARFDSCT